MGPAGGSGYTPATFTTTAAALTLFDENIKAARASLAAVDAARNIGGLTALARAEFANHDFAAARDHAVQLAPLDPGKGEPLAILVDA